MSRKIFIKQVKPQTQSLKVLRCSNSPTRCFKQKKKVFKFSQIKHEHNNLNFNMFIFIINNIKNTTRPPKIKQYYLESFKYF